MSGGSLAAPAPKPGEDMLGEFGDLFGNAQMVFELLQKIQFLDKFDKILSSIKKFSPFCNF